MTVGDETKAWRDSTAPGGALLAAVVLGLGVLAVLFEVLFLDQCLLSLDNRLYPPYSVHWPEDAEARSMNVLTSDINGFVMPETLVQLERWGDGELPLWNDRQNVGQPLFADMGFVGLYPTALLYAVMDPLRAFAWSMALHVFALGMGTFLLFRRLGQGQAPALLGAVIVAFGGFIAVHLHVPNFVRVAAWLPWIWLAGHRLAERPGPGRAAALGALVGCSLLAGFPQLAFLGIYAAAAWFLVRVFARAEARLRALAWGVAGVAAGGALSAVLLLPGVELYGESWRGQGVDEQSWDRKVLQPEAFAAIAVPHLFGTPVQDVGLDQPPRRWEEFPAFRDWLDDGDEYDIQNNFVENTVYVGLLPLGLAIAGLMFGWRRRGRDLFFLSLLLISALAATGAPGVSALVQKLPGLSTGNPKRILYLFGFALAWWAATGWDLTGRGRGRTWWVIAGGLLALGAAAAMPFEAWFFTEAGDDRAWFREVVRPDLVFAAAAGVGALVVALIVGKGRPALASGVVVGLTVLDLVLFARHANPPIDRADQWASTPAVEVLRERGAGTDHRLLTFGSQEVLGGSVAQVHGLRCANGITAMVDDQTGRLLHALEPGLVDPNDPRFVRHLQSATSAKSPLLDLLGVRWIVANMDASAYAGGEPTLDQIHWDPREGVSIIERSTALPPVFFVDRAERIEDAEARLDALVDAEFKPAEVAIVEEAVEGLGDGGAEVRRFERVRPERMELEVDCAGASLLVFSESHYPGWEVEVDGAAAELLRVDHALMGVVVPPGAEEVLFEYRPAVFRRGAIASITALVALLAMAGMSWRARRGGEVASGRPRP